MRTWLLTLVAVLAVAPGCTDRLAPGQPFDNITAHNTEDTGRWRVIGRSEHDRRIAIRIEAERPQHAELIARKAIDQWLSGSPLQVVVDVYPASNGTVTPVAHVVWQRPTHIRIATDVPDTRGTVPSDREGSPKRAVGLDAH